MASANISTTVFHHMSGCPDDTDLCERITLKAGRGDDSTSLTMGLFGLDLHIFMKPVHVDQFLDKLEAAIDNYQLDKVKEEPTSADTTDIHDPPDMGMDDRSRED